MSLPPLAEQVETARTAREARERRRRESNEMLIVCGTLILIGFALGVWFYRMVIA